MTNWIPDLSNDTGPLYQRLAERIESDIDTGVLKEGTKLPPQRDLAYEIRTTVGTVGRAYAVLRERGLVSGEVGRGTYILARKAGEQGQMRLGPEGTRPVDAPADKLRLDTTAAPDVGQGVLIGEMLARIAGDHAGEVASYTRTFPAHWFEAGSRWLARSGFAPTPDSVVPTLGVHAGAMTLIAALTNPGDYVLFEHLTYAQVARAATLIGRRIALVKSDDQGIDPDEFDAVCAQKHPKLAFLMPSAQNPTCSTLPQDRREAIAAIARKHNVMLIEDDLYGHMTDDGVPLIAEFAPERTFVLGGLSKSVSAGVRGAWIAAPDSYRHRLRVAHKLLTGGLPFVLAESAAQLVNSGEAHRIDRRSTQELTERLEIVRRVLSGYSFAARPNTPFAWLALPEPWNSGTFKQAALDSGVLLDDEDEFKAGRSEQVFHRVRFGFSAGSRADVEAGMRIVRRLLDEGPVGYAHFD